MTPEPSDPEPVRFRPSKKRKTYRQRVDDDDNDNTQDTTAADPNDIKSTNTKPDPTPRAVAADYFPSDADSEPTETQPAVVKARRRPLRGVGFRAGSRPGDVQTTSALVLRDQSQDGSDTAALVAGINDRFTHQTGLVDDVYDRHMFVYPTKMTLQVTLYCQSESRLSSRKAPTASQKPQDGSPSGEGQSTAHASPNGAIPDTSTEERKPVQPIMEGKLMEVNLQTQQPTREQQTGQQKTREGQAPSSSGPAAKKPRLGPDGKPWRSRKRRGSDDIKRDQLVEAFLHENRLDVYDRQPEAKPVTADGQEDARFAEEFQRQFMEDAAQRANKKKKVKPTTTAQTSQAGGKAGATEDVLKGPKLGGSRNSRAAVRDMLLKKEKEGKK